MQKYDYQVTSLVESLDEDVQRIMQRVYNAGFDSMTIEVYPNGRPTMATFNFFEGEDHYWVEVDANGNLSHVRRG